MKIRSFLLIMAGMLIGLSMAYGQNDNDSKEKKRDKKEKTDTRPVRSPFENGLLLDRNSIVQPRAKSFEFVIQHRFGNLNSGQFDLLGIFGSSNIRLGLNYAIWDKFQIGVGTSKNKLVQDLNWKWAILQQTREGRIPLFITYYGDAAVEALKKENYAKAAHRFSYFHEIIIGRKFHKIFSAQINFCYAHFNVVDSSSFIPEGSTEPVNHDRKHDNFGIGISGRFKATNQISILFEYDQPLVFLDVDQSQPNVTLGIEISTGSHSFQIFFGSYKAIIPQYNLVYNTNKFWEGDIMLGFNITRMWNY